MKWDREALARVIAESFGDNYDEIAGNKGDWIDERGKFGGRFRDVNEPKRCDYDDMADAAIVEIERQMAAGGV